LDSASAYPADIALGEAVREHVSNRDPAK